MTGGGQQANRTYYSANYSTYFSVSNPGGANGYVRVKVSGDYFVCSQMSYGGQIVPFIQHYDANDSIISSLGNCTTCFIAYLG